MKNTLILILALAAAMPNYGAEVIADVPTIEQAEKLAICLGRLKVIEYERHIKGIIQAVKVGDAIADIYNPINIQAGIKWRLQNEISPEHYPRIKKYITSDLYLHFLAGQVVFYEKCANGVDLTKWSGATHRMQQCNDLYFRLEFDRFELLEHTDRKLRSKRKFIRRHFPSEKPDYDKAIQLIQERNRRHFLAENRSERQKRKLPAYKLAAFCGQFDGLADAELAEVYTMALEPWYYELQRAYYLGILDAIDMGDVATASEQ